MIDCPCADTMRTGPAQVSVPSLPGHAAPPGSAQAAAGGAHGRTRATGGRTLSTVDAQASRDVALAAALAAADKSGHDLRILDVGDLLGITDCFVLVSAANPRRLRAIVDEVETRLRDRARRPLRREGGPEGGWVLLDYGDLVVHVFSDEQRQHYALDRLWGDAPEVTLPDEVTASLAAAAHRAPADGSARAQVGSS